MGLGDCKACVAYRDEIKHLRDLLAQTLNMIAPKTAEIRESPEVVEAEEVVKYGE